MMELGLPEMKVLEKGDEVIVREYEAKLKNEIAAKERKLKAKNAALERDLLGKKLKAFMDSAYEIGYP